MRTICIADEPVLIILVKLLNALLVFVAFVAQVITKTRIVMNAGGFDDGKYVSVFVVIGSVGGLITVHGSPFLTLVSHDRIIMGLTTYFTKGHVKSRLTDSV